MNIHLYRVTLVVVLSSCCTACTVIPPWHLCYDNPKNLSGPSQGPETSFQELAYSSSPLLEVIDLAWTNGIGKDKNPLRRYYYLAPPAQPLFFWTKVKGDRSTVEALQRNGQFFIWHIWYHDNQFVNKVPLEIGGPELLHVLASSAQVNGSFTWRTWSRKVFKPYENSKGLWQVKLFYSNMTPIRCGQQPCEYKIWIR